ncbi:MAG: pantetheine-phosphate adenylyltransferase [Thermoplasmata archaeon]|jgi:pantetheine-phosphate adenylyltransferase
MKVAVGGTFHILHRGHRKLLEKAFSIGDHVLIGLTSDEFASMNRKYRVRPYEERKYDIEKFVKNFGKDFEIRRIDDHFGPTINEDFDSIVVSHETYRYALEINTIRKRKGMKILAIHSIGRVLAEDLIPISSSRIMEGKIDAEGRRILPVRVKACTKNEQKLMAIENGFRKILKDVVVEGKEFISMVKQPYGEQTLECAIKRARCAIEGSDYGIGIEAGLFYHPSISKYMDVHYVVIVDSLGNFNFSSSVGFTYPEIVISNLKGKSISDSFEITYGLKDIGRGEGAIGFLTGGELTREKIIEDAVYLALLQKKSELYYL